MTIDPKCYGNYIEMKPERNYNKYYTKIVGEYFSDKSEKVNPKRKEFLDKITSQKGRNIEI